MNILGFILMAAIAMIYSFNITNEFDIVIAAGAFLAALMFLNRVIFPDGEPNDD